MAWARWNQDRTARDELRALAQGLLFWIVGGSITGTGLISLGVFLSYQRLPPGLAENSWVSGVRGLWAVPLGFGIVVLIHAFDVGRNRRTILRILSKLQSERQDATPSGRAGKDSGL